MTPEEKSRRIMTACLVTLLVMIVAFAAFGDQAPDWLRDALIKLNAIVD